MLKQVRVISFSKQYAKKSLILNEIRHFQNASSTPFLNQFINQQKQDIFEVRQKRFVISNIQNKVLGFIDLFDYEPIHRRAGVGLFIIESFRNLGLGKQALNLLHIFTKKHLNIKNLFANVGKENSLSNRLFLSSGYRQVGLKTKWNFYEDAFHDEYLYQKTL